MSAERMEAGAELDVRVAVEVMGWKLLDGEWRSPLYVSQTYPDGPGPWSLPEFSKSIEAAMFAVAEVQRKRPGLRFNLFGGDAPLPIGGRGPRNPFGWRAEFFISSSGTRHGEAHAPTAPHAIALAALAALPKGTP